MTTKSAVMRDLPLLILFGLIVVATILLGAHHVTELPLLAFGVSDHLGALCLIAVHELLRPVHYGFHALLIAGFAFAVWDRVRAFRQSGWILGMLQTQDSQSIGKLIEAAGRAEIAMIRVVPVAGLPVPAFTAGWLRPRVYVAVELIDILGVSELAAVLAHEAYHVRRRDPLRLFAIRFMGALLFWVPVGRTLARVAADTAELAADDAAAAIVGRTTLANALIRTAQRFTRSAPAWSAPFHSPHFLEYRVGRLLNAPTKSSNPPSASRPALLAGGILLLAALSGAIMAHPLPDHRAHCEHRSENPFGHLVCRLNHTPQKSGCPHARLSPASHPHAG